MKIDKDQILDLLRSPDEPGDRDKVQRAQQELPSQVDTEDEHHQDLLGRFGIDPAELLTRFSGGGGLNL